MLKKFVPLEAYLSQHIIMSTSVGILHVPHFPHPKSLNPLSLKRINIYVGSSQKNLSFTASLDDQRTHALFLVCKPVVGLHAMIIAWPYRVGILSF